MNSIVVKDPNKEVVHTLASNGDEALFGRDPKKCKVLFAPNARGVSRIHAILRWKSNQIAEFTDLSSHGTLVNGKKCVGASQVLNFGENRLRIGESDYFVIVEEKQPDVEVISETLQSSSFFTNKDRKRKSDASLALDLNSQAIRGPVRKKFATPKIPEKPEIIFEKVSPIAEVPTEPIRTSREQRKRETPEVEDEIKIEKVSPVFVQENVVKPSRKRELRTPSETPNRSKRAPSPMVFNENTTQSRDNNDKSILKPMRYSKSPERVVKKKEVSPENCYRKKASNLTFFTNLIRSDYQKPSNITMSTTTNDTTTTKVNFKRFRPKNSVNSTTSTVSQASTVRIKLVDYRKLKT